MAVVYYPKQSVVLKRDTISASFEQVVLNTTPNTILYFGSGSLSEISGSTIYITSSHSLTSSFFQGSIQSSSYSLSASYAPISQTYQTNTISSSFASSSISSSYSLNSLTSSYVSPIGFPVSTLSGSSHYSMSASDVFKHFRVNHLTNTNLWIQPQSSASYAPESEIVIEQMGLGSVSISGSLNVTINNSATYLRKTYEQYSVIGLKKVSDNVWTLFGDRATV